MRLLLASIFFLFQMIATLSQPFFTSFEPISANLIEWDQVNYTYYTGQTIRMNWTSQNFTGSDLARIQYSGSGGTRTLTSGSGIQTGSYSIRLSDSSNGITANVPLTISHSTNTTNSLDSTNKITVIQSKLMNLALYNNNATVASGATLLCDNGNLTVVWRGLGQAQIGAVSVIVKSTFGSGTTVGTAISGLTAAGNMTVNYVLPRSFSPSGFSNYAATITVQEPGQTAYTITSNTFKLSAAPSVTPTPTPSITPSKTSTPSISSSPSNTPTPSPSPSNTPSPSVTSSLTQSSTPTSSLTPSSTPTQTPTSSVSVSPTPSFSVTPTPAASLDLAAIAAAAANSVDRSTPAIAGALGGIGGILLLFGAFKWYQRKVMTMQRKKRLAMSARFALQANSMYGIQELPGNTQVLHPNIVMYTVQNQKRNVLTSKATKKGFPPIQGTSV